MPKNIQRGLPNTLAQVVTMEPISRILALARSRLFLQAWLVMLGWSLLAGVIIAGLCVLASRLLALHVPGWVYPLLAGLVMVVAPLLAMTRRPSREKVAAILDERLALEDHLMTALYVQSQKNQKVSQPFSDKVITRAQQLASKAEVSGAIKLRLTPAWGYATLVGALVVLLAFTLPAMDLLGKEQQATDEAQETLAAQQAQTQIQKALAVIEPVKQVRSKNDQSADANAQDPFTALSEMTQADLSSPQSRKEAAAKMLELQQRLAKQEAEARKKFEPVQNAMSRLKTQEKGPADAFTNALRRGDFEEAQSEIQKLGQSLQEMSPEERQQFAKQMDELSQQMEAMAKEQAQREGAQQSQADASDEAGKSGEAAEANNANNAQVSEGSEAATQPADSPQEKPPAESAPSRWTKSLADSLKRMSEGAKQSQPDAVEQPEQPEQPTTQPATPPQNQTAKNPPPQQGEPEQSAEGEPSQQGQPGEPQQSAQGEPSQQGEAGEPQQSAQGEPSQQGEAGEPQQSAQGEPSQQGEAGEPQQSAQGEPSQQSQPGEPQQSAQSEPSQQGQAGEPQQSAQGEPSPQGELGEPQQSAQGEPSQQGQPGEPQQSAQGEQSQPGQQDQQPQESAQGEKSQPSEQGQQQCEQAGKDAGDQLSEMAQQSREIQKLNQAQKQAQQAARQMTQQPGQQQGNQPGNPPGQQQGNQPGQQPGNQPGNPTVAESRQGGAPGQGAGSHSVSGSSTPDHRGPAQPYEVRKEVAPNDPRGKVLSTWVKDEQNKKGSSGVEFEQAVSQASQQAEQALSQDQVPARYRPNIKEYFDQIAPSANTPAADETGDASSSSPSSSSSSSNSQE